MERSDFIKWLKEKTSYESKWSNGDSEWRDLMNWAEYIWDELYVEEDKVIFSWEDWEFDEVEYRTNNYSFEEFVELYESGRLKN